MKDLPNLDFVRSVAVISVVAEHTLLVLGIKQVGPFPIEYMGVLGVMVFYVLTALVLMWSLERRPHTLDFYIRRWFRIYPLALASVAAALLFHAPTGGNPQHFFSYTHPHLKDVASQFALLPLFVPVSPLLVGPMWSLTYEVQMYALLPVIFFFVRRNFSLWPLFVIWGLVAVDTRHTPDHNFATSIDYFLPGIMAYVAFGRWKPRLPGWMLPPFLLCAWAAFLPHCNFHRVWWFCLVIGLALPLFRQIKSEAILAPSRQIAKYSYGIYLTHMFALVIGFYLLAGHSLPIRLLGELVPLIVLPVLAYHLLEHPMIRLGSRLAAHAEQRYEQREMKHFRELPPQSAADSFGT
jgi:peptidoglycan/LPS O-acetylase OafA/YrhL